jgi:CBS domain-containing protein
MEGEPPSAGREFAMAIAGPVVSLLLAIGFAVLAWIGVGAGWPGAVLVLFAYLSSINFTVLVFNMVPAFPLDGGRVLRSILWAATARLRRATYWASLCGQGFAWLLIVLGVVQFIERNVFGGVWLGLIGMFLNNAARGSYQQVLVKELLEGEPVRRFMNPAPIVVSPDLSLRDLVEDFVYRYHRKAFPVVSGESVVGYITTQMLSRYPSEEWDQHTVGEAMERDLQAVTISPDTDALEALRRMQRTGSSRLLVLDGGRLVRILSLKDLLRFLQLRLELEGEEEGPQGLRPSHADHPEQKAADAPLEGHHVERG